MSFSDEPRPASSRSCAKPRSVVSELVAATIERVGAAGEGMRAMGKVMGALQPQVKGRADGAAVAAEVRRQPLRVDEAEQRLGRGHAVGPGGDDGDVDDVDGVLAALPLLAGEDLTGVGQPPCVGAHAGTTSTTRSAMRSVRSGS